MAEKKCIDVLVILALKEEFKEFARFLHAEGILLSDETPVGGPRHQSFTISTPSRELDCRAYYVGAMGKANMTAALDVFLDFYETRYVVNVGISGSISKDLNLADVIIATAVDDPFQGAKLLGNHWEFTHNYLQVSPISASISRIDTEERLTFNNWQLRCRINAEQLGIHDHVVQLHSGPIACGHAVIDDPNVKQQLKDTADRKYLAVDMESHAVAAGAQLPNQTKRFEAVLIRAISDKADGTKSETDQGNHDRPEGLPQPGKWRRLAMQNASALFLATVHLMFNSNESPRAEFDHASRLTIKKYLANTNYLAQAPADDQKAVIDIFLRAGSDSSDALLEVMRRLEQNGPTIEIIQGPSTTGKSLILHYIYNQLRELGDNQIPVLLDAKYALTSQGVSEVFAPIIQRVNNHLEYFQSKRITLLIDNLPNQTAIVQAIRTTASKIGCSIVVTLHGSGGSDGQGLSTNPIAIDDSRTDLLVKIVAKHVRNGTVHIERIDVGEILAFAQRHRIPAIDLLYAFLFASASTGLRTINITDLFENFVLETYVKTGETVEEIASLAFEWQLRKRGVFRGYHQDINDYLVARHITATWVKLNQMPQVQFNSTLDQIDNVYTHKINALCKFLIKDEEQSIFESCRRVLLSNSSDKLQAYACYLLGRLKQPAVTDLARNELRRKLSEVGNRSPQKVDDREFLLMRRSIFISLSCLGDDEMRDVYVKELLGSRRSDDLNRGFHMEYYGDIPTDTKDPLQKYDDQRPCPLTHRELLSRLKKPDNKLFDIEFQTLCSLHIHRQLGGCADGELVKEFVDYLELETTKRLLRSAGLRNLYDVALETLTKSLSVQTVLEIPLQLKTRLRTGWLNRGLRGKDGLRSESVMDHTMGAVNIAFLILPDTLQDVPHYSKSRVLEMLMFHDLGEVRTGDITPDRMTEAKKSEQRLFIQQFSTLCHFVGLEGGERVATLVEEFESDRGLNAKIARDIDRLELLLQLFIYKKSKLDMLGLSDLLEDVLNSLESDLVQDFIQKKLLEIVR
jgi:5'-deoxynucleotidase YfbR-like HD superfamily hydrolase/nucleoside phosphorylase